MLAARSSRFLARWDQAHDLYCQHQKSWLVDAGEPTEVGYGMLELHPNGYGFLRRPKNNYRRERSDPFVPGTMIDRFRLRQGVMIRGLGEFNR